MIFAKKVLGWFIITVTGIVFFGLLLDDTSRRHDAILQECSIEAGRKLASREDPSQFSPSFLNWLSTIDCMHERGLQLKEGCRADQKKCWTTTERRPQDGQ